MPAAIPNNRQCSWRARKLNLPGDEILQPFLGIEERLQTWVRSAELSEWPTG